MDLENMQPNSLVKEKGIFIVNVLNTVLVSDLHVTPWCTFVMHTITCFHSIHINYFCEIV